MADEPKVETPTPAPESPVVAAVSEVISAVIPTKKINIPFYAACLAVFVLCFVTYSILMKYRRTQVTLDSKTTEVTTISKQLEETKSAYSDYKKATESHTTWSKKPYVFKGKLIMDGKGNPVYITTYAKGDSSLASGSASMATTLTESVTVTQAVTVTVHEKKDTQSGVPIQGAVWLALPPSVFIGKMPSLGVGVDHQFIFDTTVGLEAGSDDLTKILENHYFKVLLGHGIP